MSVINLSVVLCVHISTLYICRSFAFSVFCVTVASCVCHFKCHVFVICLLSVLYGIRTLCLAFAFSGYTVWIYHRVFAICFNFFGCYVARMRCVSII